MKFKLKKINNTIEAVVTEDQRVVGVITEIEKRSWHGVQAGGGHE